MDTMDPTDAIGQTSSVGQWMERYSWAYVDAAKTQLSLLQRSLSGGSLRPSLADAARLTAALDELGMQTVILRYILADVIARDSASLQPESQTNGAKRTFGRDADEAGALPE